ncbi:hypothetical protein [Desulfallas thermosapovorans]|uniref:4Fe-4S ferredoxin-type domain-containing protein n=1 Tax=Desulfallas thermosapovorans DSM 6562 TaxID=1121431 RepID=A0A5S4ZRQ3_9FIRM|nr:hypothetical protein [Desulfallas thermosapovorans]TYO95336.1 hypothetical protein LX24_01687 [Desulfallas thermosapovorans DSM 6562]
MLNALQNRIIIHPENCRGCRRCEMACAWTDQGLVNPRLAGIRIWKLEDEGKDYPVFNQLCLDSFCGKELPEERGSGVPACVGSCLFNALEMAGGNGNE